MTLMLIAATFNVDRTSKGCYLLLVPKQYERYTDTSHNRQTTQQKTHQISQTHQLVEDTLECRRQTRYLRHTRQTRQISETHQIKDSQKSRPIYCMGCSVFIQRVKTASVRILLEASGTLMIEDIYRWCSNIPLHGCLSTSFSIMSFQFVTGCYFSDINKYY